MGCNSSKSANEAVAAPTEAPKATKEITLYVNGLSPFARTTMMVAQTAVGVNVKYVEIDLMKGEQKEEWYLKLNPKHTVPVLVDGEKILTESVDISKHLIDNYGKCKGIKSCLDLLPSYQMRTLLEKKASKSRQSSSTFTKLLLQLFPKLCFLFSFMESLKM